MSSSSQEYIPPRYLKRIPKINPNIIIPAKYKVTVATLQEVVNEMGERFAKAIDDIHTIHANDVNNLKDKIVYDLKVVFINFGQCSVLTLGIQQKILAC